MRASFSDSAVSSWKCVAKSERQRLAVLLNKFEEMSYADIAATMEMSPQAVKSLLSRARVNLKEKLEPYLESGVRPPEV